jgi:hypothetical protein
MRFFALTRRFNIFTRFCALFLEKKVFRNKQAGEDGEEERTLQIWLIKE